MRSVFVAATRQHVGKSTTSLGLLAALSSRVPLEEIGYLKPVGQQHVEVQAAAEGAPPLRVDKDCRLAKEYFGLRCEYKHMSPVLMPRGFTKSYVDGEIDMERQKQALLHAWEALRAAHPNVVVEGTGHMGVGSIVGLDNAAVAKLLGLEVVLVCEGGLGSAFDELSLNLAVCAAQGVKVRCVVLNRVQPAKVEMMRDYLGRALGRIGVPLAGLVPTEPFLAAPSMGDFAALLGQRLISGDEHVLRHCGGVQFVTCSVRRFEERLAEGEYSDRLLVVHGSRLGILEACLRHHAQTGEIRGGVIFTGTRHSWAPDEPILARLRESRIPTMHAPLETTEVAERIQKFTAKLNATDRQRTEAAIRHVQAHVDMDVLLGGTAAGGLASPRRGV